MVYGISRQIWRWCMELVAKFGDGVWRLVAKFGDGVAKFGISRQIWRWCKFGDLVAKFGDGKDFLCLDNEHIFGGDQGYTPEIMDEILTTARNLELEENEDDIEELIMGHEDELTTEELQ
ncbi:hypothetical protein TNCV_212241 [Trichonephila clavipes]|nr:hypothetical protein TNCV_212241 [Trichonephila clavipes]